MLKKKVIQRVVVGGLIFKGGKLLLLQRSDDEDVFPSQWEIPSGKKDNLEIVTDCLVREMWEETGLRVKPLQPIQAFNYQIEKENEIRDNTQINYTLEVIGSYKITLSKEHQKFSWVDPDDVNGYEMTNLMKEIVMGSFTSNFK